MSPLDPSLLIATAIAFGLIHDYLEHKLEKEKSTGFWVEWLAWAIILAVYWSISIIRQYDTSSTSATRLEEAAVFEERPQRTNDAWVLPAISFCVVGGGFLWQSEHENYNWAVVGPSDYLVHG